MNVTIPTSWSEVKGEHLPKLAPLFLADRFSLVDIFFALLSLKWYNPKDWIKLYRLSHVPASVLVKHTGWILDEEIRLKGWKLPKLKGLFGPDEDFRSVTWKEFIVADSIFCAYWQNKDPELLKNLSLTLFRKKGAAERFDPASDQFCGDVRIPFKGHVTEQNRRKVDRWPSRLHLAVLLNYIAIRRTIEEQYPRVFSSSSPGDDGGLKGWEPVTISVSGEKFGDLEKTERTPFRKVLKLLEMNAIELEKIKRRNGKH